VEEVAAPWAGFHTFRHTFASLHLSQDTNLLQLSRALGHHSPAFTLTRYTHLLPGDEAPALDLASDLSHSLSGPLRERSFPAQSAPLFVAKIDFAFARRQLLLVVSRVPAVAASASR